MLHKFLMENEKEILSMTEKKARDLAEGGPNSEQLKKGIPIFYRQLMNVLRSGQEKQWEASIDKAGMARAARESNESAMSVASGRRNEVQVAETAGRHGIELLRLGYTLSHVVHAYGSMCQSITELAMIKKANITPGEFRDLNHCLDVAMAGAVTEFASKQTFDESNREIQHLGFLAHELRNSLNTVVMAFELIKDGSVTPRGSTGQLLEDGLKRLDKLIDRSLTEVRMKVEPKVVSEPTYIFQVIDQIAVTARIHARSRQQTLEVQIDPKLIAEVDQQLLHSAVSNLIQNAIKYTRDGGKIQIRGSLVGENIVIEVEDECGGLAPNAETDLFKAFEQQNEDRSGLGLGLTIAQRAINLNHGTIAVKNHPGVGCVFKITIPQNVIPENKGQMPRSQPETQATPH